MAAIIGLNEFTIGMDLNKGFVPLFSHVCIAGGPQSGLHLGVSSRVA